MKFLMFISIFLLLAGGAIGVGFGSLWLMEKLDGPEGLVGLMVLGMLAWFAARLVWG